MTDPADFRPVSETCPHCGLVLHPDGTGSVRLDRSWVEHRDVCDGAPMCACSCESDGCPERAEGDGLRPDLCSSCQDVCAEDARHGAMVDESYEWKVGV